VSSALARAGNPDMNQRAYLVRIAPISGIPKCSRAGSESRQLQTLVLTVSRASGRKWEPGAGKDSFAASAKSSASEDPALKQERRSEPRLKLG
jgi:hypothetical protein